MTDHHPITPPPELVELWCEQLFGCSDKPEIAAYELARLSAEHGADQELEACCEWAQGYAECGDSLRIARRPKPPSLAEEALANLDRLVGDRDTLGVVAQAAIIRRALEKLQQLEEQQ